MKLCASILPSSFAAATLMLAGSWSCSAQQAGGGVAGRVRNRDGASNNSNNNIAIGTNSGNSWHGRNTRSYSVRSASGTYTFQRDADDENDPDTYTCSDDSKNPCNKAQVESGQFYFTHPENEKFVQCDEWGGCFEMDCSSGTVWDQHAYTCVVGHAEDDGFGSSRSGTYRTGSIPLCEQRTGMIYETVDFEVDDSICGTRDDVASSLETAFLSFFQEEAGTCGSDRDVDALVLVEFEQAQSCALDYGSGLGRRRLLHDESSPEGQSRDSLREGERGLQNVQQSVGRFNRRSKCTRCRRRLEQGEANGGYPPEEERNDEDVRVSSRRGLAAAMACGAGTVWNEQYEVCAHDCDPNGCANPCTTEAIAEGNFYHEYCRSKDHFVQCDEFYGCFVMPCAPGTRWSQADQTCVADDDGGAGSRVDGGGGAIPVTGINNGSGTTTTAATGAAGGTTTKATEGGATAKPESGTTTKPEVATTVKTESGTTAEPECLVDLVGALRDAGFKDATYAKILEVREVDCASAAECSWPGNTGACCGMCGCSCSFPSASLCEAEGYCISQACPFRADFCNGFGEEDGGSTTCVAADRSY